MPSVTLSSDPSQVTGDDLAGFFVGWPDPPTNDERFEIVRAAYMIVIARDARGSVVGLVWELCTDVGDENTIWLYVRAGNDSALEAHRSSSAADKLRSVLMPAIVGDPVFRDLVPHFVNHP